MFKFKQFSVEQDRCAMKIGTDGVLLGAWTPITNNPYSILDIGSGTGILSLMLAQRSNAEQLDAIEIDEEAFEQCVDNFENSPWGDRLYCFHAGLDEFTEEMEGVKYDLIISNPPYHIENYFSNDEKRDIARFTNSLPFEELIESASILLSDTGIFSVITPHSSEDLFILIAQKFNLNPFQITRVKGTPSTEIKRSLMAFSRSNQDTLKIDELIIETSRHQYTEDYTSLTKDFYIKM